MIGFAVSQGGQLPEEMGIDPNQVSYFPPRRRSGNIANQDVIDSTAIPRTESKKTAVKQGPLSGATSRPTGSAPPTLPFLQ